MPWLGAQVYAIRHFSILLWSPYEWFGQSLVGQVQPGVTSPFTFLLALAPLHNGQIQIYYVHVWYVLIHCAAGLFAYWFFADLGCAAGPAVLGAIFYATGGFCGNTEWPQHLAPAIWAPLVFLFLLRSLRGRAPFRNAAWAGAALGMSWLCGHHAPSMSLTYAVAAVGVAALFRRGARAQAALRLAVVFGVMALVAAVQVAARRRVRQAGQAVDGDWSAHLERQSGIPGARRQRPGPHRSAARGDAGRQRFAVRPVHGNGGAQPGRHRGLELVPPARGADVPAAGRRRVAVHIVQVRSSIWNPVRAGADGREIARADRHPFALSFRRGVAGGAGRQRPGFRRRRAVPRDREGAASGSAASPSDSSRW